MPLSSFRGVEGLDGVRFLFVMGGGGTNCIGVPGVEGGLLSGELYIGWVPGVRGTLGVLGVRGGGGRKVCDCGPGGCIPILYWLFIAGIPIGGMPMRFGFGG